MASTIPPILIQLQADVSDLKTGLAKAEQAIEGVGNTVKTQTGFFEKFKATFAGVFAADIGTRGLMMVKDLISSSIADAQNYEKVINQLKAGIESTGNVAGLSVTNMRALASSLESLSGVDENLILQSQAVLQTFTNIRNVAGENNDIFNQASKAALDLSVKMGGDLQGATLQLGKALNDPIKGLTALRRVGVAFTLEQEQQIKTLMNSGDVMGAQKIILAELSKEFGGAAQAAGDTFAGAVFRAKDKVADFTRDLILNLQPILLTIGKILGDLINTYLKPLFKFLSDNKEAVLAFVTVIGTAIAAFKIYQGVLAAVNLVQTAFNAIMTANPIGLTVVALAALAAGFVTAWNHSQTFRDVVVKVADVVLQAFAALVRAVGNIGEAILNVVTGPLRTLLNSIKGLPGVGGLATSALNTINGAIAGVGNTADKVANATDNLRTKITSLANTKISIPGVGKTPTDTSAITAAIAPTAVTKEAQAAAAKAAADAAKASSAQATASALATTTTAKTTVPAVLKRFESAEIGGEMRGATTTASTNVIINGYNLADPASVAQQVVSAAKFGQTVQVLSPDAPAMAASGGSSGGGRFEAVAL